jgi:hypothetical protein
LWKNERQIVFYAGVNAHRQNGVAECRIRDLQNLARTMLIHAQQRWPEAVTTNLWPYMANDSLNATTNMQHHQRATPELLFTNTKVSHNPNTGTNLIVQHLY